MRKTNIIGIVLLTLLILSTSAYIVDEQYTNAWDTNNSLEILNMNGTDNQTLYINLPKYMDVLSGNINLSTQDNLQIFKTYIDDELIYESISTQLYAYWLFDNNGNNEVFNNSRLEVTGYTHGVLGQAMTTTTGLAYNNTFASNMIKHSGNISTISCWFNHTNNDPDKVSFSMTDSNSITDGLMMWHDGGGNWEVRAYYNTALKWLIDIGSGVGFGTWDMTTVTTNGSYVTLWKNNAIVGNATSDFFLHPSFVNFSIGGGVIGANPQTLSADNCVFDENTWNKTKVNSSYNNGYGVLEDNDVPDPLNNSIMLTGFEDDINQYLDDCTADISGNCTVPFIFSSNSSGNLTTEIFNINASRYYANYSFTALDTGLPLNPSCYLDGELWNYTSPNSWLTVNLRNLSCSLGGYSSYSESIYFLNNTENITLEPHNLNLIFKDEDTQETLSGVTIGGGVISDDYATNFSTSTGTYALNLTVPSEYTIRYQADGYGKIREYYFTLTDQSVTNLTLYLLNDTGSTDTTVTVYDESTLLEVSGAYVYLMRFDILTNSYITVAEYKTDIAGKSYFDAEHENELYKFLVEYPKGTARLTTDPLYISSANINLYISLTDDPTSGYFNLLSITGVPEYSTDSNTFDVTYNDPSFIGSNYCFYIKTYGQYSTTTINSSCSTSPSGSISLGGMTQNTTYYAVFTAFIDGEETVIGTAWKEFLSSELNAGGLGLFLTAFIIMLMAFLSTVHIYALILSSIGLVFAKFLGLISISWGVIIVVLIGAIILGMIIQMKK
jgi:hypothetical protein